MYVNQIKLNEQRYIKMLGASHMGSWYPTGKELNNMLNDAYNQVQITPEPGLVRAIIVPHAGYRFCAKTAMHAFAQVNPELYDRAIVIGPSHRVPIPCCTIADATSAETPYGPIPFDTELAQTLLKKYSNLFEKLDIPTAEVEHSMEMEFPLLKYIFKDKPFKIVPIMVGSIKNEKCTEVAAALEKECGDSRTLYVISSDFCHWGARFHFQYLPDVPGKIYQKIEAMDREATKHIASCNPTNFETYLDRTKNTICGRKAILIMMRIFKQFKSQFPDYTHSSNITSNDDSCVSYMAGVIRTD